MNTRTYKQYPPHSPERHAILKGHEVVAVKDVLEWAAFFETADRQVARTEVRKNVLVSTVFIGINMGFMPGDLWFESIVFGGWLDEEQDRYETWDEAVAGHARLVRKVKWFSWYYGLRKWWRS